MPTTYIAFIECSLKEGWDDHEHILDPVMEKEKFEAIEDNAEIYIVDIKGDRRLFSFKKNSYVKIVNNVIIFEPDDVEEIAIDESKQFPKKKRMDE